jgi:glycerol-3-phosphate dehydrogenase
VPFAAAAGVRPGTAYDAPPATAEEHLRRRYGALASEIAAYVRTEPSLAERIVEDMPELRAEVVWAVEHEMAMTLEDVLMRRLHIHLRSREKDSAVAAEVARLMGARLGWDAQRIEAEVRRYEDVLARGRALIDQSGGAAALHATGTR